MYTASNVDTDGRNLITSNSISDISYHDIDVSFFANPGSSFTGYAADGFKRNAGVVNSADQASWASEAASANRGDADGFPSRVFFVANGNSLSILDADDLRVWMRFNYAASVKQCVYSNGYLVLRFATNIHIYSFAQDKFWYFSNTAVVQYSNLSTRNGPSSGTNGLAGARLQTSAPLDIDIKRVGNKWLVGVAEFVGLSCFDVASFNIASSSIVKHDFSLSYTLNTSVHTNATISSTSIVQNPPFNGTRTNFAAIALYGDRLQLTAPQSTDTSIRIVSGGLGEIKFIDPNSVLTAATVTSLTLKILKPFSKSLFFL